jgi:hypothetical protein
MYDDFTISSTWLSMRNDGNGGNMDLGILTDLHVLGTLQYEEMRFMECHLSVCACVPMYIWPDIHLASA